MTATPKKTAPRKAAPRKAAPPAETPAGDELEHAPDPNLTLGTPPASPQSDETPQADVSGPSSGQTPDNAGQAPDSSDLGVSGQPAEYAPLPGRSEPRGELRESPRPGTERYRELMAQADAQAVQPAPPEPLYAGTFALYANPQDEGGFVLVLIMADGTREEKKIPSALVKLMQNGGGMMGKLSGLRKFIGNGLD